MPDPFPSTPILDPFIDPSAPENLSVYNASWSLWPLRTSQFQTIIGGGAGRSDGVFPANYWNPSRFPNSEVFVTLLSLPSSELRLWGRVTDPSLGLSPGVYLDVSLSGGVTIFARTTSNNLLFTAGLPNPGDAVGLRIFGGRVEYWLKPQGTAVFVFQGYASSPDVVATGDGYVAFDSFSESALKLSNFGGGLYVPLAAQQQQPLSVSAQLGM